MNNISQICYCCQISLESDAANCSFCYNLTPLVCTIYFAGDGTCHPSVMCIPNPVNQKRCSEGYKHLHFIAIRILVMNVNDLISIAGPWLEGIHCIRCIADSKYHFIISLRNYRKPMSTKVL